MDLEKFATKIRIETLKTLKHRTFGHIGGSLSMIECLAVLYGKTMKIDPQNPALADRDYFILSKGHGGPALYATLALKGYFEIEKLLTLNNNGTMLPSHPDRNLTPGVDMTTGSLGQGLSVAVGLAKAFKLKGSKQRVYCMIGDGELDEGQCFEAIQFASHQNLNNFILFVDYNKKQLDGYTDKISNHYDLINKFKAFNLNALKVAGNDVNLIDQAIEDAINSNQPSVIVLDTIKGQGVPYFENLSDNHHVRFSDEEVKLMAETIANLEMTL